MIRLFFVTLIILAISSSAIWMIENNGTVEILWLGYLVKTDILTSIVILIIAYYALAITFWIFSKIFSINLKKLFSTNKLKALTKLLQKDEQSFDSIFKILQNLENGDNKEALKNHKELVKTSKNLDLNDFLLAKIHFCLGDYKKSQEVAKKIEDPESSILILASELELALKKKDEEKTLDLAEKIISRSTKDSQNKSFKKALKIKINNFFKNEDYISAKDLLDEYSRLKDDPDFTKIFLQTNCGLALKSFEKKSFISSIKYANKALRFDQNYIMAHEIRLRSWIALGFGIKARNEIKKLYKQTKDPVFLALFDESNEGLSPEKKSQAMKKFLGVSSTKPNKMMNFLNKTFKKSSAIVKNQDLAKDLDK